MAYIRPVNPSTDYAHLDHVFRVTAGLSYQQEPAATLGSHLFCHAYPALVPRTCFALDDGTGNPVGYILGAADTAALASIWLDKYAPNIRQDVNALQRPTTRAGEDFVRALQDMLLEHPEDMLNLSLAKRCPAHFHINILPSHQKLGWGEKMIEMFCTALAKQRVTGVHLGLEAGNTRAEQFYARLGFERVQGDPQKDTHGERGELDAEGGAVYMVKSLVMS